ncbi:MAG: aspartate aminotransferase family protein [Bacteroidetes bacterium]|nr:aspartate aminotransferase family protein [Bacteroidota bacterium]
MSVIDELDVGYLQIRFCEGQGLSHKGITMMNERKGESHMSTQLNNKNGRMLYDYAKNVLVSGGSASARWLQALKAPLYFKEGKGSSLIDVDGNEYIDMCTSHGGSIFGHKHPAIVNAIQKALDMGILCSYETEYQSKLAGKICEMVPAAELCRYTCSGTEATMHAIRLAREYTGKDVIIKFEAHFHGYHDYVQYSYWPDLDKAGSYESPVPIPASGGMPEGIKDYIRVISFNDIELLEKAIKENKENLAAVICEPINYNIGCAVPDVQYMQAMRKITEENHILLIYDEILSAFRTGPGCAQEYFGVIPDICTIGKCVAGGTPLSIIAGKKEIMKHMMPIGNSAHSGTYAGHLIPIMAANAAVDEIVKPYFYKHLYTLADSLYSGYKDIFSRSKLNIKIQGLGARFGFYFDIKKDIVRTWRDCAENNTAMNFKFYELMLDKKVYFHDYGGRPCHHGFSIQHTLEDINEVLNRTEDTIKEMEK